MENDTCRFRECSSRNKAFSPRGKFISPKGRFFLLREKIADNFTSSREKAREGHVPPIRLVLIGRGLSSPTGEGCGDGKVGDVYHSS